MKPIDTDTGTHWDIRYDRKVDYRLSGGTWWFKGTNDVYWSESVGFNLFDDYGQAITADSFKAKQYLKEK